MQLALPRLGVVEKKMPLRIGFENEMAQTSVVQITAMYCHGHFSPKVAKPLHSSNKNTRKKNSYVGMNQIPSS
jgi:hypothetical protein